MIRVGTAGWSYPDWEGIVYPRRKPPGFHPLAHLARFFPCVELNSSFYGLPRVEHARNWVRLVREHDAFRFVVKLQQVFTHEPLPDDEGELDRMAGAFWQAITPLHQADRLAALLVQFPLSFRASAQGVRRLQRLADRFRGARLVLEVRHRSWYEPKELEVLERLGYSLARIDLPAFRDHPPPQAPTFGPLGYLRLHGRNRKTWFHPKSGRDQRYDYLYGPEEIAEILQVTRRLAEAHDETFVITNNHFSGKAVANAIEILAGLQEQVPLAPIELMEAFPRLASSSRAAGQGKLF